MLYTKDNTLLVQPIFKENIFCKICDISKSKPLKFSKLKHILEEKSLFYGVIVRTYWMTLVAETIGQERVSYISATNLKSTMESFYSQK